MKRIYVILLLALFSLNSLFAGNLTVSPQKPTPKSPINVNYSPDGRFFMGEELLLQVYAFTKSSSLPKAYEIKMNYSKRNLTYSATYQVPSDVVFVLMKVGNGKIFDINHQNYWSLKFYTKDDKPLPSANLFDGISYLGNFPENINRYVDYNEALKYLNDEIYYYPANIQAQIGYTSLLLDLRKINYSEYKDKINTILNKSSKPKNEYDVKALSRALKSINQLDKAKELEQNYASSHRKSELAEELIIAKLGKIKTLDEFSDAVIKYLKTYPASDNRERIFSALTSGYLQAGKVQKLLEILKWIDNTPAGVYSQIAFALLNNDKLMSNSSPSEKLEKAFKLMETAITIVKENNIKFKPIYITESEWEKRNRVRYAGLLEQYGEMLMANEFNDKAYEKFSDAIRIYKEDTPSSLYENLIKLNILMDRTKTAYKIAKTSIQSYHYTKYIEKKFKKLYKEVNQSEEVEAYLVRLKSRAKFNHLKKLEYDKLNRPVNTDNITSFKGKELNLNNEKGKIKILQFWSTWCNPCQDALTGFNKLYKDNKLESELLFAAVDIWENRKTSMKDIKKYIKDSELKIPFYYDKKSSLPLQLGITGLPVTCILDKHNNLQFVIKGYTNDDEFVKDVQDKIDLLIQE